MGNNQSRYGSNSHYESLRDDYKTPKCIYGPVLNFFKRKEFDIDVCCSDKNIPAKKHYTKQEDGLIQPWKGLCFCNPPWKTAIKWVKKGANEVKTNPDLTVVYVLSSDKMYIGYVQDEFLKNPDAVFCVLRNKQGFIIPGQEDKAPVPSVGTMIAILSKHAGEIQYGLNYYNTFDTTIFMGKKIRGGQCEIF